MQECCFHSLLLSGTVLSFHSFSLFSPLFSPKWGSPLMPRQGSGYRFLCPASAPQPRLTCLHSSALIWRSQGPPPLCGVQTLTSSAEKESRANSLELSCSDPDQRLLVESHVQSWGVRLGLGQDHISGFSAKGKRFFRVEANLLP